MGIMTRCNRCKTKISYGNSYCDRCKSIVNKEKREGRTTKNKEADKFLKGNQWQSLRAEVIRRDKGCCKLCFKRGQVTYKSLSVHHIYKRSSYSSEAYNTNNLATVCKGCHEELEKLPAREQFELLGMQYFEPSGESDNGLVFYL